MEEPPQPGSDVAVGTLWEVAERETGVAIEIGGTADGQPV